MIPILLTACCLFMLVVGCYQQNKWKEQRDLYVCKSLANIEKRVANLEGNVEASSPAECH